MNIKGFIKVSLLDYPKTVAATVFTGGCNFLCPFCHNGDLVITSDQLDNIDENDVLNYLKSRIGLIDGLCITGGEPTLQKDLFSFMKKVKDIGVKIKLDTNGYNPSAIKYVIENDLVDYIAMDIKNSDDKYAITTGINNLDISIINESINLIMNSNIDYEFRTTVVKELHTKDDILAISRKISGCQKYCLQQFRPSDKQLTSDLHAIDDGIIKQWLPDITKYITDVELRGLE